MSKTILKQRLDETKTKLKSICKDAHFADELISNLLSIKGQLEHEPTLEHILVDDIDKEYQDEKFYIAKLKDTRLLYKLYGGYTIICDSRQTALYETIDGILTLALDAEKDSDELPEEVSTALSVIGYVLTAPVYAFTDETLAFKIATCIVEYLVELQKESESTELTPDDNEYYTNTREALSTIEDIKQDIEIDGES